MLSESLWSAFAGAHIGPEPTTDRFVVVMVNSAEFRISLCRCNRCIRLFKLLIVICEGSFVENMKQCNICRKSLNMEFTSLVTYGIPPNMLALLGMLANVKEAYCTHH
jgi:hypothetical protein